MRILFAVTAIVFCSLPRIVVADTNTISFGSASWELLEPQAEVRYGWDSGDTLIAEFGGSGSIGGITGGKNVVVVPEVKAFGNTIVPEVRRDTRSGFKLSTQYDGRAGIVLSAGMTLGGNGINGRLDAGPTLSLPDSVNAGRFFSLVGDTILEASSHLDPNLPEFDAGLDIIIEGSARGSVEYGLFPFTGYQIGDFDFNIPSISLPIIDFGLNLNLPELPEFNFLNIPQIDSDEDNTFFRKTLPTDPLKSFGEFAVSKPLATQISATAIDDNALVTTTTGDIARLGLDLDGIASFALAGASFTGQEIPIKKGETKLGTLRYDTIDVKYGVELGYEIEDRLDTFLEATLNFVDPTTGEPKNVLIRDGDELSLGDTFSGRWDQLPELALVDSEDVQVQVDFTGIKRELSQKGSLTLSDYMELRVLEMSASVRLGLASIGLGPLFYKKLDLAGEFAAFEIYDESITLSDLGLTDGLWDNDGSDPNERILINAVPTVDTYLNSLAGALETSNLRRLETHEAPDSLASSVIMIGTADESATIRAELVPGVYTDDGSRTTFEASWQRLVPFPPISVEYSEYADPQTLTAIDGLFVPNSSRYLLPADAARRFRLRDVTNDGEIIGNGYLGFGSPDPDSVLTIHGRGTIRFESVGEVTGGLLLHGEGHTIEFHGRNDWTSGFERVNGPRNSTQLLGAPSYYFGEYQGDVISTRVVTATQQLLNQGSIISDDSAVRVSAPQLDNSGLMQSRNGGDLEIISPLNGQLTHSGRIESLGSSTGRASTVSVNTPSIVGTPASATAGLFLAANGGKMDFQSDDLGTVVLSKSLEFVADADSTITFHKPVVVQDGLAHLVTKEGGTIRLSGLGRNHLPAMGTAKITNDGLLELVAGRNSLRDPTPVFFGSDPLIDPIDLENRGTVRIHAGAAFDFDVNIVDYAEGGATFAGGTWELLGANIRFANNGDITNQTAAMNVRVSDVYGSAEAFDDFVFDETVDEETGEVRATTINDLDTELAINAANVVLSGAAKFSYFNTVRVNKGQLTLLNQQQFYTASSYENNGGTTTVDSGAGLHVAGGLFVNGGRVWFGEATEIGIDGTMVEQPDGTMAQRHIEVNGGELTFANGSFLDPDMISRSLSDGVLLKSNRTWVVSDSVETTEDGSEIVTPGVIDFQITSLNGTAGIVSSDATVILEGEQAVFEAFEEHLINQNGTLIVREGKVYETMNDSFINLGSVIVEGAQFRLPLGEFRNQGTLTVNRDSYLQADVLNLLSGDVHIDGVVDARTVTIDSDVDLAGGFFSGESIAIAGSGEFTVSGGTLLTRSLDGSLIIDTGRFAPGQSIGIADILGNYTQRADGQLEIEWGVEGADQVKVRDAAALAGHLEVALLNGFAPEIGVSVEFLSATAVTGAFDPVIFVRGAVPDRALAVRREGGNMLIDVVQAPRGDFTSNNVLDPGDIDSLGIEIRMGRNNLIFDVNSDGQVSELDRIAWVHDVNQTYFGDADLNGVFDSNDLTTVLAANRYEADIAAGWANGDFNSSGRFDSADLIDALADGGYEQGPRVALNTVPEPTGLVLILIALTAIATQHGRRRVAAGHTA